MRKGMIWTFVIALLWNLSTGVVWAEPKDRAGEPTSSTFEVPTLDWAAPVISRLWGSLSRLARWHDGSPRDLPSLDPSSRDLGSWSAGSSPSSTVGVLPTGSDTPRDDEEPTSPLPPAGPLAPVTNYAGYPQIDPGG